MTNLNTYYIVSSCVLGIDYCYFDTKIRYSRIGRTYALLTIKFN